MSKKNKNCRTCSICKFSKNYNRFGYLEFPQHGWILICTNECNKHFGKRYLDVVETNEIPFNERCKCLSVDNELKKIADEQDKRIKLLKQMTKHQKNQEDTYGTCQQPFPDNTWIHCLQIEAALKNMY